MGNKKTPLLQSLRQSGGTLYVFPSAYEDIGLNLQSTTTGVAMSHYALINIPTLTKAQILKNAEFLNSAGERLSGDAVYALSLQNYAMNFETYLINREGYNYQELSTVSERVFWNWMKHIGAFSDSNLADSKAGNGIYYEDQNNPNQVVKCVGSIDAGNTLSTEFGIYNETYINIPTSYGSARYYFEVLEDSNYNSKDSYIVNNQNDPKELQGRDDNVDYYSYHQIDGVTLDQAIYSSERGDSTISTRNEYVVADSNDCITLVKDINVLSKYYDIDYNKGELITSFDDINIDIDNIRGDVKTEFDFNAIFLYYSVYDQDDIVKTSYATNLFGIIFIDGTKVDGTGVDATVNIPTLKKKKSSNKQFGNSYSFRVNLKTQSVYDNTETIIQDNTTSNSILGIELSDVISQLNVAIDTLNTNTQVVAAIQDKYATILSRYDDLREDIEELQLTLDQFTKGVKSNKLSTKNLHVEKIIKDSSVDELLICNSDDADAIPLLKVDSSVHVNDLYVDANYDSNDIEYKESVNDQFIYNLKVRK